MKILRMRVHDERTIARDSYKTAVLLRRNESGFDLRTDCPVQLTAAFARTLAKWLTEFAEQLEADREAQR